MEYNIVEYKNDFNNLYVKLRELRPISKNLIVIIDNSSFSYIATKYADFVLFTKDPYEIEKENYINVSSMEKAIEMAIRIINPKDTLLLSSNCEQFTKKLIEYKQ